MGYMILGLVVILLVVLLVRAAAFKPTPFPEKEFAPVKNATGTDSVETARALLEKNGIEI